MFALGPVRRALLALALAGFAIGTGEFVMLGLLPQAAADLSVSIPNAGWLISAYALGVVVGAPLLTAATVGHRRRLVLVVLMSVFAIGNLGSAAAPNFELALVARFLTGLPHGAFFGVGAVVAGNMVPPAKRTAAMSVMFAGLTTANIVGVPATTLLGQHTSWRLIYLIVAVIAVCAAVMMYLFVPDSPGQRGTLGVELAVFGKPQVWLTLSVATLGGGGLFATFSYITPMMTKVAGYSPTAVTLLLALFGSGMTFGNLLGARLADRALMPTLIGSLVLEAIVALSFVFGAHNKISAAVLIFLFPATALAGLPALQSRIIALAGGAPNLAAASIQAAFNVANSIGAYLGGLVIAAGFGYTAPNLVAAGLISLGLIAAISSVLLDRRNSARRPGSTADSEVEIAHVTVGQGIAT
jgi:MFS transporter, DHA1 family, inner membrane transport protein